MKNYVKPMAICMEIHVDVICTSTLWDDQEKDNLIWIDDKNWVGK